MLQEFSIILSKDAGCHFTEEQGQALLLACERWLLCLKSIRRMILFGFQKDAKSVQVTVFTCTCMFTYAQCSFYGTDAVQSCIGLLRLLQICMNSTTSLDVCRKCLL